MQHLTEEFSKATIQDQDGLDTDDDEFFSAREEAMAIDEREERGSDVEMVDGERLVGSGATSSSGVTSSPGATSPLKIDTPVTINQESSLTSAHAGRHLAAGCAAPGCSIVSKKDLRLCTRCRAALYCGREHQNEHDAVHEKACREVGRAKRLCQQAETKLRLHIGREGFQNPPSYLWLGPEMPDYMFARFALVDVLLEIKTERAVSLALKHLLAMLHVDRADRLRVHDLVPALHLRLGQDQKAYDFCKWWVTVAQGANYDWGNGEDRFLDVENSDPFRDPQDFIREAKRSLSFAVSVVLIKIRLLIDLQAVMRDRETASPKLPSEVTDQALVHCSSSIVAKQRHILERDDQAINIMAQRRHIKQLFEAVRDSHGDFWLALVDPGLRLYARPKTLWSVDHEDQARAVLRCSHSAWVETEGAIEVIKELISSYVDGSSNWAPEPSM